MPNLLEDALAAYESGDAETTKKLVEDGISRLPESDSIALRLLRARIYEFGGYPEGADLEKAYREYHALERLTDGLDSEVLVGAARVLFDLDGDKNKGEISRLCQDAIELDGHAHAKMILGLLNEKVLKDRSNARKWYLAAYMSGLPWGALYLSRLHAADQRYFRASFLRMLMSATKRLLTFLVGKRGPLSEHGSSM